jgi:hypothetical protein
MTAPTNVQLGDGGRSGTSAGRAVVAGRVARIVSARAVS